MRRLLFLGSALAAVIVLSLAPGGASAALTQCPPVDKDTGCQFLVTVTPAGEAISEDPTQGAYEGSDDALIGVQNSTSAPVSSIHLSAEDPLFGFEEDGICSPGEGPIPAGCKVLPKNAANEATLEAGKECGYEKEIKGGTEVKATIIESCGFPPPAGEPAGVTFPAGVEPVGFAANGDAVSGYEGPTSWFTGIGALGSFEFGSGTINFSPAIPPGGFSYFSLESPPAGGFGSASTLSTALSASTVVQGTPVTDSATLGGPNATIATGSVAYNVYSDPGCSKLVTAAGAGALNGGIAAPSTAVNLGPGKYYWQAAYGGDVNAKAVSSVCGSEVLTVLAPTATSTAQTGGGVTGASITVPTGTAVSDVAHVSGALAASSTGSVSYILYKDSKCTIAAAAASIAAVSKGVAGASAAAKPGVGTYYWKATYSGDAVNAGSASACGSEVLVVAAKRNLGLASVLGTGKQCVSKRRFIAHPRGPKGAKLLSVEVQVNGKRASVGKLRHGATTINLVGLPKGTFKVALIATSSKGQTFEDVRTFHTCVPKRHKHH